MIWLESHSDHSLGLRNCWVSIWIGIMIGLACSFESNCPTPPDEALSSRRTHSFSQGLAVRMSCCCFWSNRYTSSTAFTICMLLSISQRRMAIADWLLPEVLPDAMAPHYCHLVVTDASCSLADLHLVTEESRYFVGFTSYWSASKQCMLIYIGCWQ